MDGRSNAVATTTTITNTSEQYCVAVVAATAAAVATTAPDKSNIAMSILLREYTLTHNLYIYIYYECVSVYMI